jgi:transposase-like protein/IS1 family transposase
MGLKCPNIKCAGSGMNRTGSIIRHGFYQTKWGKRRRFHCQTCGRTFCSNSGTPYHRLQHRRTTFDEVAMLSVEGLNKSAIARVKRIAWNTVDRWLQRAADSCRCFNDQKIDGIAISELQADEIRTIIHDKEQPMWIFAAIEVWSRLWPSTVVGRRSYRNTLTLFRDISSRSNLECVPLIATDGFAFYAKVVRRVFGPACLYGQVIKTRRNDRIVKVERRAAIGTAWRFEQALRNSEDSSKLNTSFIERLNLTIRQGSAYLFRGTICHARWKERLEDHLELLRCYYNFIRPHRALKFGSETRTPAMQAGLVSKRLSFREVFVAVPERIRFMIIFINVSIELSGISERKMAA